jgi:N-acetyl-gamma-glutamyl-phosphate reductase
LGNDFRLTKRQRIQWKSFVYGLPELNKAAIKTLNLTNLVLQQQFNACAFGESRYSQLMFISMPQQRLQAGVSPSKRHISVGDQNMSHYKAFEHQHLGEINQSVNNCKRNIQRIDFVPNRVILPEDMPHIHNNRRKSGRFSSKI